MLHRRRGELGANLSEHRVALAPDVAVGADLDQLVRTQVDVDFVKHGRRQSVLADGDDGMQMVRPSAQLAPLDGSQVQHLLSVTDGESGDDGLVALWPGGRRGLSAVR